ncbi:hypothetical protein B0H13DRAFT_2226257 [Mycena leptocephala]|nr:hypothetical protein B0H13DRAFT_2226257 [Mycena leptocephala]
MIFAGDFAQLPPVKQAALFSGDTTVSPILHSMMSISKQKNTVGKIIRQQVTTVVILKQNMRQTANTPEDEKFRTALANMRCSGHPTFQDANFRNVSLITALNSQKDKINEMGCIKFSAETNQELAHFYLLTMQVQMRGEQIVRATKLLPIHRQQQLWDAHPSFTSKHIPGKLSLCLGLPILIRATLIFLLRVAHTYPDSLQTPQK